MKTIHLVAFVCAIAGACAQTRIDLASQGRNVNFADATSTIPLKVGTALPPTCKTGELFFLTTAVGGNNIFGCIAANVWSPEGASNASGAGVNSISGKSGVVTLEASDINDCRIVRASAKVLVISACSFGFPGAGRRTLPPATVTLLSGFGSVYVYVTPTGNVELLRNGTLIISCEGCVDAGLGTQFPADVAPVGRWSALADSWNAMTTADDRTFFNGPAQLAPDPGIRIQSGLYGQKKIGVDTAIVQTRAAFQSAQDTFCIGAGDVSAQTCSLAAKLWAYTPGMSIRFVPSATNTGAMTLNIDGLGARPVRQANGIDDLASGALVAGAYYHLVYDGSAFRIPVNPGAKVRMTHYANAGGANYGWTGVALPNAGGTSVPMHFPLHPSWLKSSGVNVRVYFKVSSAPATTGLRTEVSCTGPGDSVADPFSGTVASVAADMFPAAQDAQSVLTMSFGASALPSSCASGRMAHVRVLRDTGDVYSGSVDVLGIETEYWVKVE